MQSDIININMKIMQSIHGDDRHQIQGTVTSREARKREMRC